MALSSSLPPADCKFHGACSGLLRTVTGRKTTWGRPPGLPSRRAARPYRGAPGPRFSGAARTPAGELAHISQPKSDEDVAHGQRDVLFAVRQVADGGGVDALVRAEMPE